MHPILIAFIIILISYLVFKNFKNTKKINHPPGPIRLPLIGSYLTLLWIDYKRPHLSLTKLKDFYNSSVISWGMGSFNVVVANNYESCKEVFNNPHLQGRVPAYPALLRTYGSANGYFGDDGDRWLSMKRQSLRALRDLGFGRRSETFEMVIQEELQNLVDHLTNLEGAPTLAPDVFYPTNFNLVNHILYGFRLPQKDRETLVRLGNISKRMLLSSDSTGRLLAIWPWIRHIIPKTSGYTDLFGSFTDFDAHMKPLLKDHHKDFDPEIRRDLIDFFLEKRAEHPEWTTDEEILSCCMDLMMPNAAVSTLISYSLGFLLENPEKLVKCQKELDEVVGRGRFPTIDDRQNLQMIDFTIRETMRIQPITPLGVPHRATVDTTLCGYDVPAESLIITNLWAMNHDEKTWEDPEVFRPERFMGSKDYTFSFGLGKRVCAGETYARNNYFLILATILQNFDVEMTTPLDRERFLYGGAGMPNPDLAFRFQLRA